MKIFRRGLTFFLFALSLSLLSCGGETPLSITPDQVTLPTGGSQTFKAGGVDLSKVAVTWRVQEGAAGGTITSGGVYTAPAFAGVYHVTVSRPGSGANSATATVTVTGGAAVSIDPAAADLTVGGSQTFTATVTGSSDTAVAWSIQEGTAGGSVTADGTYTAPATPGTYHLIAASHADPTKSASATITVTSGAVVSVAISPAVIGLITGESHDFDATVSGSSNTAVTWSVEEAGGGTVDGNGIYTAPMTAGTYHLIATSQADPSKSASATITVTVTLVSISVTPGNPTVKVGATRQFTALGAFSDGNSSDLTASVTWNSSNTAAATIDSSGLATGVAPGST